MGISSISTTDTQYLHIPAVLESLAQSDDPMAAQVAGWLHYIQFMGGTVGVKGISEENGQLALSFSVSGLETPTSATDRWYESLSGDPYGFGITGLTDARRVTIGNRMMNTISSGGVTAWMRGNSLSTVEGMSSVLTNLPQVLQLAAILEANGITNLLELPTMDKTSDEYKQIDRVLRNAGYSAEFATEAVKDLNEEAFYAGLRATMAYGDATEDVITLMQQMKDGADGAAASVTGLAQAIENLKSIQEVKGAYSGSNPTLSPEIVGKAMDLIPGLTEQEAYENPQYV